MTAHKKKTPNTVLVDCGTRLRHANDLLNAYHRGLRDGAAPIRRFFDFAPVAFCFRVYWRLRELRPQKSKA
jgi:hypothetical protein